VTPDRSAEATHHPDCSYCDRLCERCGYIINSGWDHIEQPQAPDSNVVVCSLVRHKAPLSDAVNEYLDHKTKGHLMSEAELWWRRGFDHDGRKIAKKPVRP
jgi:hypothetical protein